MTDDLYRMHRARLVRFCRHYVPDCAAEDMAHEAFIRVWRRAPEHVEYAYLAVTARNLCNDWHNARHEDGYGPPEVHWDNYPSDLAADHAAARRAFACLPERHQATLWDRYVMGLTAHEIAARDGMTANAVDQLTHRARVAMRAAL